MMDELPTGFARLPTPAKILLIISLALLPIGLASAWSAKRGFDTANAASLGRARDQAKLSAAKALAVSPMRAGTWPRTTRTDERA